MANYGESIRLARLYEKTSKNGNVYLTGRLGGAKVAILKSREVAEDGGAIWEIMLSAAPDRTRYESRQIEASEPKPEPVQFAGGGYLHDDEAPEIPF